VSLNKSLYLSLNVSAGLSFLLRLCRNLNLNLDLRLYRGLIQQKMSGRHCVSSAASAVGRAVDIRRCES